MLTYEKALQMVRAVKETYPYLDDASHVVAMTDLLGIPYIEAHFEHEATAAPPSVLDSTLETGVLKVKHLENVPPAQLLCGVLGGTSARAEFAPSGGTAGWNLQLDARKMCLSNWHVFQPFDSRTDTITFETGGTPAIGKISQVKGEVRAVLTDGTLNEWDLALATYDDPAVPCATMVAASCHHARYPTELADDCTAGEEHRKVGANTGGTCGKLVGFGDVTLPYPIGPGKIGHAKFTGQLIFDIDAAQGDSGSVAIRSSDNCVTGLLCATIGARRVVANPLFRINWQRLGTINGLPDFKTLETSLR